MNNSKGLLILCLSLATFGVNEAWGACPYDDISLLPTSFPKKGTFPSSIDIASGDNPYGVSAFKLTVSFDAGAKTITVKPQYSLDKSTWTDLASEQEINTNAFSGKSVNFSANNLSIPASNKIYLRIAVTSSKDYSSTRTLSFSNFSFTKATTLTPAANVTIGKTKIDDSNSNTFKVGYSNMESKTLTVTSDQSCFVPSTNIGLDCSGEKEVTVTYNPTCDNHATSATITLKVGSSITETVTANASWALNDGQQVNWRTLTDAEKKMQKNATLSIADYASAKYSNGEGAVCYTSSNSSVISVGSDGHTLTAVSVGTAKITAYVGDGCKYVGAESSEVTFAVSDKATPKFTPNWTSTDLKVGDKVTLTVENVSDGLNGYFKGTAAKDDGKDILGITRSGNTITIEALNAGSSTATFTQTETDDIFGANQEYTFSVTKIDNTLAVAATTHSMYVEDVWNPIISSKNSDATITTTTTDGTVAYYDVANNKIVAQNTNNQSFNSKEVTITISQAETYKYTEASKTIKVTVNKWDNTLYINGTANSLSHSMFVDEKWGISLTATNNDYSGSPITATPNNDVTTINDANTQVSSNYKIGTTSWTISQPENYKYKAANATLTVNVVKQEEATNCYVLNEPSTKDIGIYSNKEGIGYSLSGPGEKMTLNVWRESAATNEINVYGYTANNTESTLATYDASGMPTSPTPKTINNISSDIVKIKIKAGGTLDKHFSDVLITRKTYLEAPAVELPTAERPNVEKEGELVVNWSCANGGDLKIANDNPKFTIDQTTIPDVDCKTGSTQIKVHYVSSAVGTDVAHLVIYNNVYRTETTITGKTEKLTPVITWTPDEETFNVGDELIATSNSEGKITLSMAAEQAGYVTIDGNKLTIIGVPETNDGKLTITATVAEDPNYNTLTESKTIIVTNKTKQYITWNQSFGNIKTTDADITLAASVESGLPCRYTCDDTNGAVVRLQQNGNTWTLQIVGEGEANITAYQDGNDEYAAASSITKHVLVFDPTKPCPTGGILLSGTETVKNNDSRYYSVSCPKSLTFSEKSSNGLVAANLFVYQKVNGAWKKLYEQTSRSTSYKTFTLTAANGLDINATEIEFRTSANYGHDIKDVSYVRETHVTPTAESSYTMTVMPGQKDTKTFTIDYSNSRLLLSFENDDNTAFSVSPNIVGDCGMPGVQTVTITYAPKQGGSETNTLYIKQHTGEVVKSITLSGSATKIAQKITGNNVQSSYNTTDKVTLTAEADSKLTEFVYTALPEGVAEFDGNVMTFKKSCDNLSITITQPGNTSYEPCSMTVSNIKVNKVTPTIVTPPTVGNTITYGSPLSAIALTGGAAKDDKNNAVAGHFEWANPNEIPHGGQQNYTVRFVPDNTNIYTSDAVSTETVAIMVNKANQTLTWDVEDPIKIKKEDGNYTLTASSTSGRAITYTLSDPSLGTINDNILTPLISGDCKITAICPADGDYNESNAIEKQLLIAGPDEIVWKYKNGDRVWAGQNLNADGQLATAHNEVWFGGDLIHLEVSNNTDPKKVYTAIASDGTLVTISATTVGDDYYVSVNSSIQVYIDHCYQGLNWDQSFVSYTATAGGQIDETIPLTAVAVDSLNKPTNLPIVYSVDNLAVAEITGNATNGWNLHIKGAGNATLTASVAQTNIYQGVTETRQIIVRKEGERCGSYALISTSEKNMNEINENTYTFNVPGETLTFKTRKFTAITLNTEITVEGWNNSTNVWEKIGAYTLDNTGNQTKTYTLGENVRKVKITPNTTFESNYRYVSDLYVTQKEYLRTSINEINESIYINEDFSKVITIDHSDKPYINCVVDNDQLEIVRSGTESDCGKAGTLILTLKNKNNWNTPREIKDTITLTTSVGDNVQIPVHIQVELGGTYKFTNAKGDGDWNNLQNWNYGGSTPSSLPQMRNPVEIHQPVHISSNVEVYGLELRNDAQQGTNGSITIAPTGGLTVYNGGVSGLNDKLIIESTQENTGFFRVAPSVVNNWAAMPVATVEFATKSTLDNGANHDAEWQYFGVAVNGVKFTADYITWLYDWDETKGWVNMKDDKEHDLLPFHGYVITQYGQPTYPFHGPLLMKDVDITLTKTSGGMNGDNIFANSYPAPIDVKNFTEEDFEGNVEKVFYLFNSGSWNQWQAGQDKDNVRANSLDNTPGTYYAIPALSANYLDNSYQTIIPPMSGVYVIANENGAKIHLRYEKHVWNAVSSNMNRPLRAPQKVQDEEYNLPLDIIPVDTVNYAARLSHRVVLSVRSAKSGNDRISILERQDDSHFTQDYDNGYDATKFLTEGITNIYTNELAGTLAISATNNVDSMFIGFSAGEDEMYELSVSSVVGEGLKLMDMQTMEQFTLENEMTYSFWATPNSDDPYRFRIFKTNKASDTPTGWDNLGNENKIWYNNQTLFISDASVNSVAEIFTASGSLIKQVTFNNNTTISTEDMPEGVYSIRVEGSVLKFFVKH